MAARKIPKADPSPEQLCVCWLNVETKETHTHTPVLLCSCLGISVPETNCLSTSVCETNCLSTSVCETNCLSRSVPETNCLSTSVCETNCLSTSVCETNCLSTSVSKTNCLSTSVSETNCLSRSVSETNCLSRSVPETNCLSTSVSETNSLSRSVHFFSWQSCPWNSRSRSVSEINWLLCSSRSDPCCYITSNRSANNYFSMDRPGHHSIDRLKERGVEKGSSRCSTLRGRERSLFNRTNINSAPCRGQPWKDCWEVGRSAYGPLGALRRILSRH